MIDENIVINDNNTNSRMNHAMSLELWKLRDHRSSVFVVKDVMADERKHSNSRNKAL